MIGLIGKSGLQTGLVVALMLASVNAMRNRKGPQGTDFGCFAEAKVAGVIEAKSKAKAAELLLGLTDAPDEKLDQKLGRQMAEMMAEAIRLREARIRSIAKTLNRRQKQALWEELKKPDAPIAMDELIRKVSGDLSN